MIIAKYLETIDTIEKGIEEVKKSCPTFFKEDESRKFLKTFFEEMYESVKETIEGAEKVQPFAMSSVDYRIMEKLANRLKFLLDKYKNFFILSGAVKVDDIEQEKIKIIKFIKK